MFEIIFYELENGRKPAWEFMDTLDAKMKAKTLRDLDMLEKWGYMLREPQSKAIEDGIFELRTVMGSNISRILYFFYDGKRIILTNGFIKKSMKTPRAEIEKAKKYKTAYLARKEHTK